MKNIYIFRLIKTRKFNWHLIFYFSGDVYLIGCTNVGKSSLFNALLHSDFCKTEAIDLIQRATVSPWPGTTLNLLKVSSQLTYFIKYSLG